MPANGYWLEVVDATIPQNRAAASTLASARMADVHGLIKIASGFTGCPHGMRRKKKGVKQTYCQGCGTWGDTTHADIFEVRALEEQPVNERKELSVRRSDR